jgi:hypothetical protein
VAQRTVVQMTDDLTGEQLPEGDGETVGFGVDGVTYEIDLSTEQARVFRDSLAAYVEAARRPGGTARGRSTPRRVSAGVDNAAVRAWAASNGIALNTRGRIPRTVIDQFLAAGN